MTDDLVTMSEVLISDPLGAWEGKRARTMVRDVQAAWLAGLAKWHTFMTLTFRDPRPGDVCNRYYRRLVQALNKDAFGNRYVRKVGHSYFSYVVATEYQRRDVIHFHVLVDRPINYDLVHGLWEHMAGFAWLGPVRSQEEVTNYVSKYCVKGGQVEIYLATKSRVPMVGPLPIWWWVEDKASERQS